MMRLPKGTIPLMPDVIEQRAQRFARLVEHYENAAVDNRLPGGGEHDRYAVLARCAGPTDNIWRFTRVSSFARAEVNAMACVKHGWEVECAFDLDILDGPTPALQVGDEVLSDDGMRWLSIEATQRRYSDGSRVILHTAEGFVFEDETDEDGGVRRNTPDPRWPVRHDIAAIRTVVVFNTVPTPTNRWA